ncbi:MAG: nucleotide exchange factor GrpE [Lachnospiraceae bacterium]|nr:nucleotide exchange factor GrpE [Lachnospiraceae bacterium]
MADREKEQSKKDKEKETMETATEENEGTVKPDEKAIEDSAVEEAFVEDEESIVSEDAEGTAVAPEEEDSEQNGEEDHTDKKEKKRHFIKTEKKEDKLKEQLNELNDKVVRQMAEFDNYRKRTEKEKQAMFETGAKSVIEKLLPVVDNFERGLAALEEGAERTPFEEGVLMTYKQLMAELEKLDVKPLDAVGKEFDPNLHNAVMHVDDESLGENIVVEELQKGYTYRDSVVRHSMVKVAN